MPPRGLERIAWRTGPREKSLPPSVCDACPLRRRPTSDPCMPRRVRTPALFPAVDILLHLPTQEPFDSFVQLDLEVARGRGPRNGWPFGGCQRGAEVAEDLADEPDRGVGAEDREEQEGSRGEPQLGEEDLSLPPALVELGEAALSHHPG